jgi:large subunit ribosomal protein L21
MYAIIATGGKQYKAEVGDVLYIEKLGAEDDSDYTFTEIVAVSSGGGLKTGTPYLAGVSVNAKVLKTAKGKKISVFTYKPKKGSKRAMGHRQPYTKVEITAINA